MSVLGKREESVKLSLNINIKTLGVLLLIGAVLFLGVQHFRFRGIIKALCVNQGTLDANQKIIIKTLIEKQIITLDQPTPPVPPEKRE